MFMMGGGPHQHQILDISAVIIVFIVISVVLSSVFLFLGIKEFTFFSKWNKKFSKFMSLKGKIDKELGDWYHQTRIGSDLNPHISKPLIISFEYPEIVLCNISWSEA